MAEPPTKALPHQSLQAGSEKTAWPLAIGVTIILLAGIEMLLALTALIFIAVKIDHGSDFKAFPSWHSSFEVFTCIIFLFLAVFLLAGGVMLVKHMRESAAVLKAYSISNLLFACIYYSSMVFGGAAGKAPYSHETIHFICWTIGLPSSVILSVFLLAWLARKKCKTDMLMWR